MSYNKTKTDPVLGLEIHRHLVVSGVETPVEDMHYLDRKDKIDRIEDHFADIMEILDDAQDGREVEKLLDNLGKKTMQTLKANFELRKPDGLTDPKCDWSFPERVSAFQASENGKPIQGRAIHFHIIVHTA